MLQDLRIDRSFGFGSSPDHDLLSPGGDNGGAAVPKRDERYLRQTSVHLEEYEEEEENDEIVEARARDDDGEWGRIQFKPVGDTSATICVDIERLFK